MYRDVGTGQANLVSDMERHKGGKLKV